jgi:putative spermidine/putrescine transport system permease protein
MIAPLIETTVTHSIDWHLASALSVCLLIATMLSIQGFKTVLGLDNVLLGLTSRKFGTLLSRRSLLFAAGRALGAETRRMWRSLAALRCRILPKPAIRPPSASHTLRSDGILARLAGWAPRAIAVGVFLYLLVPLIVIVPMAFNPSYLISFPPTGLSVRWFAALLTRADWYEPFVQSLVVSSATAVFATALGIMAAFGLERGNSRFKGALLALFLSPLVIPTIVMAISLFFFFSDLGIIGSHAGLVLAHSLVALPLVVVVMSAALAGFDSNLEKAAANLGASPIRVSLHVIFPLLSTFILTAAFLAFMASFEELVMTMFLVRPGLKLLTVKIWEGLRNDYDNAVAAMSAVLVIIPVAILLGAELYKVLHRRRSAIRASRSGRP